jgi:hypothetical protein
LLSRLVQDILHLLHEFGILSSNRLKSI